MLEVDVKFLRGRLPIKAQFTLNTMNAGIFGVSGCGKSCLLSLLSGRLQPDEGRIVLDGQVLFDSRSSVNYLAGHPGIALVAQDCSLEAGKTVRENLSSAYDKQETRQQRFDFSTIVDLLKLDTLLDVRAQNLSQSEKLRILLGRALLAGPRLLLLDDACQLFDEQLKLQVYSFLHYAHEKHRIGVLHSTSLLSEALRLSDFLILMENGEVLSADYLNQIVANQHLLESAGGPSIDNILPVTIINHDPAYGCTLGNFFGLPLVLPYTPRARRGQTYHVGLRSQDIALSTQLLKGVSIQNQLKGRVCAVIPRLDKVLIQVDAGTTLTGEITLRAFANLNIHENDTIYCLIKTHSFQFLSVDSHVVNQKRVPCRII